MKLRELEMKDAPLMLEWMQDENVIKGLKDKFRSKTLADCQAFIKKSLTDSHNLHLAIVDEKDTYMGTVSLKNINTEKHCAEFAIAVRSCAMGKGFSQFGMKEIFRIGREERRLKVIYWSVLKTNYRAICFYEKSEMGHRIENLSFFGGTEEQNDSLFWYASDGTEGKNSLRL